MMLKEKQAPVTTDSATIPSSNFSLAKLLVPDAPAAMLILRLALGAVFIAHGGQKVMGWFGGPGLEVTVQGMSQMGIPAILAYAAAFTEFFGGIALVLGLLTRPAALGILVTMLVAIFKVHLGGGFFAPKGFEYPLTLAAISLTLLLTGPGRISLDQLLFRKK